MIRATELAEVKWRIVEPKLAEEMAEGLVFHQKWHKGMVDAMWHWKYISFPSYGLYSFMPGHWLSDVRLLSARTHIDDPKSFTPQQVRSLNLFTMSKRTVTVISWTRVGIVFFRIGNTVWVRRFVGGWKPKLNRRGLGAAKGYLKHVTALLKRYCLSVCGVVIFLKPLQSLSKLHYHVKLLPPLQVTFSR